MSEIAVLGWEFMPGAPAKGWQECTAPDIAPYTPNQLEGSPTILDALCHAHGPFLSYCEFGWPVITVISEVRFAAARRRVLWYADGRKLLREFARRCALEVADLWNAPPFVVDHLRGMAPECRELSNDCSRTHGQLCRETGSMRYARLATYVATGKPFDGLEDYDKDALYSRTAHGAASDAMSLMARARAKKAVEGVQNLPYGKQWDEKYNAAYQEAFQWCDDIMMELLEKAEKVHP